MRESILAGALVSLLPAFALAALMPDHRSGMPAALSAIPTDTSAVNAAMTLGTPVASPDFRTESDPDHMVARRVDPMKDQVKPLVGVLVTRGLPTHASESRRSTQPAGHSQPQAKTNYARTAPATPVHIYWFFGGR
jgi:hypothetical protein